MHLDDSEREVLVFGRRTAVLDTGFGQLSNVTPWFKAWSGTVYVDDQALSARDASKVLDALAEKIGGIRMSKARDLLIALPEAAAVWEAAKWSGTQEPLANIFQRGSTLTLDNHYGVPPKVVCSPIFMRLNCDAAFATGLQSLYGWYNEKRDRVVITDGYQHHQQGGTFFIVSEGGGFLGELKNAKVEIHMRSPRMHLPGGLINWAERGTLVSSQTGEVARNVHHMLKQAVSAQMHEARIGRSSREESQGGE